LAPIAETGSEEVFVAKMQLAEEASSKLAKSFCLISKFSTIASTTRSALAAVSSKLVVVEIRLEQKIKHCTVYKIKILHKEDTSQRRYFTNTRKKRKFQKKFKKKSAKKSSKNKVQKSSTKQILQKLPKTVQKNSKKGLKLKIDSKK